MTTPLTEEETRLFSLIHGFTQDHDSSDLALLRTQLDGQDVAVISEINYPGDDEDDGDVFIVPLAVLVTPALLKKLVPPEEEE